jgi:hypothetical protein
MGTGTVVTGISQSGTDIVGSYTGIPPAPAPSQGFLLRNKIFTAITLPRQTLNVRPLGVNDSHVVVGEADFNQPGPGFLGLTYGPDAGFALYSPPGPKATTFYGINNHGMIVGDYNDWGCFGPDAFCHRQAFTFLNGTYTIIAAPGAVATIIYAINDNNEILGYDLTQGGYDDYFLYRNGAFFPLSTPCDESCAINNQGDILTPNGVLSSNGTLYPVAFPGATSTQLRGISQRRHGAVDVVGNYTVGPIGSSISHGFYAVIRVQ